MLNKKTQKTGTTKTSSNGIKEVYINNFLQELNNIGRLLDRFKYIAMVNKYFNSRTPNSPV
jgi:hypothetical protein